MKRDVKINIRLERGMMDRIDALALQHSSNRSAVIRVLCLKSLNILDADEDDPKAQDVCEDYG